MCIGGPDGVTEEAPVSQGHTGGRPDRWGSVTHGAAEGRREWRAIGKDQGTSWRGRGDESTKLCCQHPRGQQGALSELT